MTRFADAFRGRRVLVTGHTGFKGSWLALWLARLGATVTGVALDAPSTPSHWALLRLPVSDVRVDVRDARALKQIVEDADPEVVFHLAAQPLVRRSYAQPTETWDVNVQGTVNVLDACRSVGSVRAIVVATTDKCYANREWPWPYRETDALGGHDPYSASKAATELAVASFRSAFFPSASGRLLATVRAGNVIGGGDWGDDRLIPDVVRAVGQREPVVIRSPHAVRPWQHVLDCLSGYLCLAQRLLAGDAACADAWNFGPATEDTRSVSAVLERLRARWPDIDWALAQGAQAHETATLRLDSSKARQALDWRPVWSIDEALDATADWYRAYHTREAVLSDDQLEQYSAAARDRSIAWASA